MDISPQTLAEMIRLGCKETTQCKRALFVDFRGDIINLCGPHSKTYREYNEKVMGQVKQACALGAAALVATDPFRFLAQVDGQLQIDIINRNDSLGHTREQIADWLETL